MADKGSARSAIEAAAKRAKVDGLCGELFTDADGVEHLCTKRLPCGDHQPAPTPKQREERECVYRFRLKGDENDENMDWVYTDNLGNLPHDAGGNGLSEWEIQTFVLDTPEHASDPEAEEREEREETAASIEAIAQRLREHAPTVTERHSISGLLNLYADSLRTHSPEEPERGTYFGTPGHCYDIDGNLWHDPGGCTEVECRNKPCCGYRKPLDSPEGPVGYVVLYHGSKDLHPHKVYRTERHARHHARLRNREQHTERFRVHPIGQPLDGEPTDA